jgi:hypothetical protein
MIHLTRPEIPNALWEVWLRPQRQSAPKSMACDGGLRALD